MNIALAVVTFHHQSIVEEAGELLDTVSGVTAVHSRYYDLCSHYHQVYVCNDGVGYFVSSLPYELQLGVLTYVLKC